MATFVTTDQFDALPQYLQLAALQLFGECLVLSPLDRLLLLTDVRERYRSFASTVTLSDDDPFFPDFGLVIASVLELLNDQITDFPTAALYAISARQDWQAAARWWARRVGMGDALESFVISPFENAKLLAELDVQPINATIH